MARAITIEEAGREHGMDQCRRSRHSGGGAHCRGRRHRRFWRCATRGSAGTAIAVGAGKPAAFAAGINVDRTKIIAFAASGTLAAIAGVMLAARLSCGSPRLANQLLLPAIAAVIVGGTAITGGLGGVWPHAPSAR